MANINDLPNELLENIFDHAFPKPPPPQTSPSINLNDPIRTLFPFNIASSCTRFLYILKANQKYWRHVVIDLAVDPTAFLDTLSLFIIEEGVYPAGIFVTIFSSDVEYVKESEFLGIPTRIRQKDAENSRSCVVFQHLERSLERCASITIDLVYQSSLPSMALFCSKTLPLLRDLRLTSLIDDEHLHETEKSPFLHTQLPSTTETFPHLTKISLAGKCFMELCYYGSQWLVLLKDLPASRNFEMAISHLRFDNDRDVQTFYDSLSSLCFIHTLTLSNLTLGYTPLESISNLSSQPHFRAGHVIFDSVSRKFLAVFLPRMLYNPDIFVISFINASVPIIQHLNTSTTSLPKLLLLQLIDMHFNAQDDSLYNAVIAFGAENIRFLRCEGVTDTLLGRLSGEYTSGLASASELQIHDCSGFTSGGLRVFVMERQRIHSEDLTGHTLQTVDVHGSGPLLSLDDAEWFLNAVLNPTRVEWNVELPNTLQPGYIANLRPERNTINILEDGDGEWYAYGASKREMYTLHWEEILEFQFYD